MTADITNVLELIAATVWLAAGIYVFIKTRKIEKRLDKVVSDLEADVQQSMTGGPWA